MDRRNSREEAGVKADGERGTMAGRENGTKGRRSRSLLYALLFGALICILLCGCGERLSKVEAYRRAGIDAMESGDYAGAAEQFQSAMSYYGTARQDSAGTDVLRYLAEAQYRSGDYAGAAESYDRLLNSDGRKEEYLVMACVCVVKSGGDLSEAVSLYEEADRGNSSGEAHQSALFTLGEALAQSGDEDLKAKAAELYQNAVNSDGETPELCARIGKICFEGGDLEQAQSYFQEGVTRAEEELAESGVSEARTEELKGILKNLRFNQAVCLEYSHNYADALKEMESIVAEYGEDDEVLMHEITFLKSRVGGESSE